MIDVDAAERYVWENARLLDRRYFAFLLEQGPAGAVVDALVAYRNPDGGFGNALEADLRAPDSQPNTTTVALFMFDEVGAFDHPAVGQAVNWLAGIATEDGGLPWALPALEAYPHAPWWAGADPAKSDLTPTAGAVAMLRKHGVEHPWLERAEADCWQMIEAETEESREHHRLVPVGTFLDHVPDRARAEATSKTLGQYIRDHLVESPAEVGPYAKTALVWSPAPDGHWAPLFTPEEIEADLAALVARQEPNGSWPLGFPAASPAAELEWRAHNTINYLKTLRAYRHLPS